MITQHTRSHDKHDNGFTSQGHGYRRLSTAPTNRSLVALSLGLGLAQIAMPREFARFIGVPDEADTDAVVRLVGAREIASGLGLLAQNNNEFWLWFRVAGDLMDLALLNKALALPDAQRERVLTAIAAVAGVTLLDVRGGMEHSGPEMRALPGQTNQGIDVRHALTINKPVEEVYQFWHNFENLPRFMGHLEAVEVYDGGRSHWKAHGPAGMQVEWDAEMVTDRPNEQIAWRSLPGADVQNAGSVRFHPAPGGRGTEVRVDLQYAPPAGKLGALVAKLFGEEPSQQVINDLRRFKQVMETGEVTVSDATTKGNKLLQPPAQPHKQ
jgi:uncharacterized membrane protein